METIQKDRTNTNHSHWYNEGRKHYQPESLNNASRKAPNSTKARLASAMICGSWDVGITVGVGVDVEDVDMDETTEDAEEVAEVVVVVGIGA